MKEAIINSSMDLIKKFFPDYNEEQLECVQYGLECIYLMSYKLIIIFLLAFLFGILKESIVLFILLNILRLTGFGLHASKSWICTILSCMVFLVSPMLCISIKSPLWLLIIISIVCFINFILYAPADTEKRPLINAKKRMIYKFITLMSAGIYILLLFFIEDVFLQNTMVCALVTQTLLIHPMIYKLFKLSYNNYKSYVLDK